MPFFHDPYLVIFQTQFEKRNDIILHKLRCYRPAPEARELLFYKPYILLCLYDSDLVVATLGLNGDDIM